MPSISPRRRIASCSGSRTIQIWDSEIGDLEVKPFGDRGEPRNSIAISPKKQQQQQRILTDGGSRELQIWDAVTGNRVGESLEGHRGALYSVAYSPDGERIVSGSSNHSVRVWEVMKPLQSRPL
ncbi:WD40 repeat-like protein [Peniophora sp. CONT]|nr:WD40 repeat-like protein [Peniophora sp. CONT]